MMVGFAVQVLVLMMTAVVVDIGIVAVVVDIVADGDIVVVVVGIDIAVDIVVVVAVAVLVDSIKHSVQLLHYPDAVSMHSYNRVKQIPFQTFYSLFGEYLNWLKEHHLMNIVVEVMKKMVRHYNILMAYLDMLFEHEDYRLVEFPRLLM